MIQSLTPSSENRTTFAWLAVFGLIGVVLVILYADADQQDAGYHYLFARWSWSEPYYLIGVWTRPLFTLIYSIPAQFGYRAAKLFTLLISLITAWQSVRSCQATAIRQCRTDGAAAPVAACLLSAFHRNPNRIYLRAPAGSRDTRLLLRTKPAGDDSHLDAGSGEA
jgi:hypothetical protein